MAYSLKLAGLCDQPHCPKQAQVRVYNNRNARVGDYCHPHGKIKEAALNRAEQESTPRPPEDGA